MSAETGADLRRYGQLVGKASPDTLASEYDDVRMPKAKKHPTLVVSSPEAT